MKKPERYAIIVAAGSGKRMGSAIPKQFLELNGRPILMRTIEKFATLNPVPQIVVVLPGEQTDYWLWLCQKHQFGIAHQLAEGGNERFYSVRNGLGAIQSPSGLVAIHDGVRPLVSTALIEQSYRTAQTYGTAIPTTQVTESVRIINGTNTQSINRKMVRLVQTPQTFDTEIITKAYEQTFQPAFTDDATVVEAAGYKIFTFEGEKNNIKITTKTDLQLAQIIINEQNT